MTARRIAVLAAAVCTSTAAASNAGPSFEEYLSAFRLSFPASELDLRRGLFHRAVEVVQQQNAKPSGLWRAGLNEFSVHTEEERRRLAGYVRPRGEEFEVRGAPSGDNQSAVLPPARWDWRDQRPNVVTPVKRQGGCWSCWAFAATAAMESAVAISTGVLHELSAQQVTSCTPNPDQCGGAGGCTGGIAPQAYSYAAQAGLASQWTYPYLSFSEGNTWTRPCEPLDNTTVRRPVAGITGFVQLPRNDELALLKAVLRNPVSVTVDCKSWLPYRSGIFDGCSPDPILDHIVVLMGYGVENGRHYWLIRNSWGAEWGEAGYIRLLRSPGNERCGIDTNPWTGYSCKTDLPDHVIACGMCGVLSDSAYPTGGFVMGPATSDLLYII